MKRSPDKREGFLVLEDGTTFQGISFGSPGSRAGEVVFSTGMVGYPESLTDPSYCGQILTLTYPLVGNYGVPNNELREGISQNFESPHVQISGLIVSSYSPDYCHWDARMSLGQWLVREKVPALTGIDTRSLTKKLRERGTMLGKIEIGEEVPLYDPNRDNLVARVSCSSPTLYKNGVGRRRVALIDCGCKHSIIRKILEHKGVEVLRVPWNHDLQEEQFDAVIISNGPGDPECCVETIEQVRKIVEHQIPIFGICLGHQILALAVGARTYKLKYGHRSQNQPVMDMRGKRCYMTSQNHGYAVLNESIPEDWRTWFINLNDHTSEGLLHRSGLMKSVQFHPEASPGPVDTSFLLDAFLETVRR